MNKRYRLVHNYTSYTFGCWESYDAADNYRLGLDDWTCWSIEQF